MSEARRVVNVTRRRIEYYTEEVDLLNHLRGNVAEIYISREGKCVEIRFPTRIEHYTHYVAHVPFDNLSYGLDTVNELIKHERHMEFLEDHVDDIIWKEEYSDTMTDWR